MRFLFIFLVSFIIQSSFFASYSLSQYAPQVGNIGSTAIHKDSSIIFTYNNFHLKNNDAQLIRGWQNIADTSFGKASVGSIDSIEIQPFLLSLGDGGSATFELLFPVIDNLGPDFVIFENGFSFSKDSFFLELAFVEVSYDGKKYVRFPSFSQTDTVTQVGAFGSLKAHQIHNLAGKYTAPYGVPFDLSEIRDSLGRSTINFIRIIDVVGSTDPKYGSADSRGQMINDPWPTPFQSGGFDLSGIGFINLVLMGEDKISKKLDVQAYPNPIISNEKLNIYCKEAISKITLMDASGLVSLELNKAIPAGEHSLDLNVLPGFYILSIQAKSGKSVNLKIVVNP